MKDYRYINASGGESGGGQGANLVLESAMFIVSLIASQNDAKKNRELTERIARMDVESRERLQSDMLQASTEIERLNIMYKTFAVLENDKLLDERKNKQRTLLYVMGSGLFILIGMAIVFRKK
jgi:hypothetical protein